MRFMRPSMVAGIKAVHLKIKAHIASGLLKDQLQNCGFLSLSTGSLTPFGLANLRTIRLCMISSLS